MRILCLCACLFPLVAAAEIYRWTDAEGRVHFGETPPAGAERIEVKPQVVERDAATREREARIQQFYQAREDEKAAAAQRAAQQQAEVSARCREWKDQLAQLSHGGRYYFKAADGERTYLSDAQVDAARRELNSRLAARCS
ncbi:hypothetical protein D3C76_693210 [compost metagenome]|uniref:DUF4124 domain-containing protein n=1 Tax=Pseudomonas jinjuensis TaxID=198616 RepID=A0A1H0Q379_9PSED|nr:DUF4124 domain-containing protein [Pseudomonas jinjuensis]SDP11475.1 protein of unknown function [Pseudomonas jinjuensis]